MSVANLDIVQKDEILSYIRELKEYRKNREFKKALQVGSRLIELLPKNPNPYNDQAITYEKMGKSKEALEYYYKAITIDPSFIKAYNNIGIILYKQHRYKDAISIFELSLKQNPNDTQTLCNLGATYNKAKLYSRAEAVLQKAISIDKKSAGAYVNLGNVYNKLLKHHDALACHLKALSFDDKSATNHANIAITYKHLEEYDKAIEEFQKAIEIDPEFANAHFDLATTYLVLGNYEDGFREYEWRFKKDEMRSLLRDHGYIFEKPKFELTFQTKDKTLLLFSEQGFGDMIHFIRFAEPLKERFPTLRLKVQCRKELKSLFEKLYFIDEVVSRDEDVGEFDYHYAIMSLPYLLGMYGSNMPNDPYITANKSFGLDTDVDKYNIGLVWGGSVTGESYPKKIFSPRDMQPLIDSEDIKLYSLQAGEDREVLKVLNISDDEIVDLSDRLTDFYQTACAIKELDLVITSDTSVAHLAGAMGKEVWVLLLKKADWRWGLESEDTIWYPSMKLFRQEVDGEWGSVFKRIFNRLQEQNAIKLAKEV
jgi:tetratricopeptide (TPR) repeat protein